MKNFLYSFVLNKSVRFLINLFIFHINGVAIMVKIIEIEKIINPKMTVYNCEKQFMRIS